MGSPRRWILLAVGLALLGGAVWLQDHFGWEVPARRSLARSAPSVRAMRTQRTMAQVEQQNPLPGSPVVLSEVLSINQDFVFDERLEAPGYVELTNRGDAPVSLHGWSVADGSDPDRRWPLPRIELAPGAQLLVWASGMDRVGSRAARLLEVTLDPDAPAERRFDTEHPSTPPKNRRRVRDPDAYGAIDVGVELPEAGVWVPWIRARAASDAFTSLVVRVDGGEERLLPLRPSRRFRQLRIGDEAGFDVPAGARRLSLRARGGPVEVGQVAWSRPRPGLEPFDLQLHADFRLRPSEETIVLLDSHGRARDYVTPPGIRPGLAYQRVPPSGSDFQWAPPTPLGRTIAPGPDLGDLPRQAEAPVTLNVPPRDDVDAWRYSLDGSIPTAEHAVVDDPLVLEGPTALRVRGFRGGRPVTAVSTHQAWIGPRPPWPVLLFALDPYALHDRDVGIFQNTAQRGRNWEKTAHLLFLDGDERLLDDRVGLRTHGGQGELVAPRTRLRFYCRPSIGPAELPRDVFQPSLGVPQRKLVIEAGSGARNRLAYSMVHAVGGLAPRSRLALVYLNGAVHNAAVLIEPVDERFLRARFGHDDFDLIKGKPLEAKRGDFTRHKQLGKSLRDEDWELADVRDEVDLDELMRLHFAQVFIEPSRGSLPTEALQGYLAYDRTQTPWRQSAIAWDLDKSFVEAEFDLLGSQPETLPPKWRSRLMPALIVQYLLAREPSVRERYLRLAEHALNHALRPGQWTGELEAMRALFTRHAEPPWLRASLDEGLDEVHAFVHARPAAVRDHLARFFDTPAPHPVRVDVDPGGRVSVDGVPQHRDYAGFYFAGGAVEISVPREARDRFVGFEIDGRRDARPELRIPVRASLDVRARFEAPRGAS